MFTKIDFNQLDLNDMAFAVRRKCLPWTLYDLNENTVLALLARTQTNKFSVGHTIRSGRFNMVCVCVSMKYVAHATIK